MLCLIFWRILVATFLKELRARIFPELQRIELTLRVIYVMYLMNISRINFSVGMDVLKMTKKLLDSRLMDSDLNNKCRSSRKQLNLTITSSESTKSFYKL